MRARGRSQRHFSAWLGVAMLASGGCDATAEPEPATLAELDVAVSRAGQALLDAPGFEGASVFFHADDPDYVFLINWVSSRANGDRIEVRRNLERDFTDAYIQVGADRWNATSVAGVEQGWESAGPAHDFPQGPATPLIVVIDHAQGRAALLPPGADPSVTRQELGDGSMVWRLTRPLAGATYADEWLIDGAGRLVLYRSNPLGPVPGGGLPAGEIRHSFSIPSTFEPIALPEVGARLDLEQLGFPDALVGFEGP